MVKQNHYKYKGEPAVLERPKVPEHLNGLLNSFYTLMASGDFTISALSKMYELAGVFNELEFYEIMLDAKNALDTERAEAQEKNGT